MEIEKNKNRTEGVTLITLCIIIIIMIMIAGISIYSIKNRVKEAELEELKTNMLLIQAKAKEYIEDATFKMGMNADDTKKASVRNEVYIENAKLQKVVDNELSSDLGITDMTTCYWLTTEAQESWGLNKMSFQKDEKYLIQFDETNETVEVYSTKGYKGNYSLTAIEQIKE